MIVVGVIGFVKFETKKEHTIISSVISSQMGPTYIQITYIRTHKTVRKKIIISKEEWLLEDDLSCMKY